MSLPIYLKSFDNLEKITNIKKNIHDQIYSTMFKKTRFAQIFNFKTDFNINFINSITNECNKFIDKKNNWGSNKKYKSFIPLLQLGIVNTMIISYIYNVGIKIIEKKYELPKWSLHVVEISVINVKDRDKYLVNNDFNYCIALKKCEITINEKTIELNVGDGIIFCGKYSFSLTDTYFLLCGIKIFGGYTAKCEHNVHPNQLIIKNINNPNIDSDKKDDSINNKNEYEQEAL